MRDHQAKDSAQGDGWSPAIARGLPSRGRIAFAKLGEYSGTYFVIMPVGDDPAMRWFVLSHKPHHDGDEFDDILTSEHADEILGAAGLRWAPRRIDAKLEDQLFGVRGRGPLARLRRLVRRRRQEVGHQSLVWPGN
jgi:hypothetical protein